MLKSMTGYGRAATTTDTSVIDVEVRCVNGRFLKTHAKLPPELIRFESAIDKLLKESFSRGTIDLYVKFERTTNPGGYVLNGKAVRAYLKQLEKLREEAGVSGPVTFELLAALPGVLTAEEESCEELDRLLPHIEDTCRDAIARAIAMREAEGVELKQDLLSHLDNLGEVLGRVRERLPQALSEYKARFEERVRALVDGTDVKLSRQDLEREVVFYIERSDMSEELSRMASHVLQFREAMENGGTMGRQLEFIGQEMHREGNTMGSKANDAELSTLVTALKTTIDKIREQVLNVE